MAATALVRLMIRRRDQLLGDVRRRMAQEKKRKQAQQRRNRTQRQEAA